MESELSEQISEQISEHNLTYLLLIQRMAQDDVDMAAHRSHLSVENVSLVCTLSMRELTQLAKNPTLLVGLGSKLSSVIQAMRNERASKDIRAHQVAMLLSAARAA